MRYGVVLPGGDARQVAAMAGAAEGAGWDGLFVYEPVWGIDPWSALAAAAMVTERIRLGTMLTPVSRRKPWELASQTQTVDNLSDGRVILAAGLGAPDTGFADFGEVTDRRVRAELLDEGLDIVCALWKGEPISYRGTHYTISPTSFPPAPPTRQQPRPPVWVVGALGRTRSMARALRYDGLIPTTLGDGGARQSTPAEIAAVRGSLPTDRPYEVVVEGVTPAGDTAAARETVEEYARAGATWWNEANWGAPSLEVVRERIEAGPPR